MGRQYEELVRAYQHKVHTFATYSLGNRDDAEDVTQEVLVKLWRHWERLEPDGIWAWLIRVTRNAVVDAHRRQRSYRNRVVADPDGDPAQHVAARVASPEDAIANEELRSELEAALARLPEPHRSIVLLREVHGMKYDEIAAVLELPLTTVKVYLHRGRRRLRQELRADEPAALRSRTTVLDPARSRGEIARR